MIRSGSIASILLFSAWAAAQDGGTPGVEAPAFAASPTLKTDTAVYNLEQGVLQYAFTFANPSDSVLYLDCQVPPKSVLIGNTLILRFDRKAGAARDSAATAGGPTAGGTVDPKDFPPQRIGPRQTFQGQRRLDRVLGDWSARPRFAKVQLEMAFYPESELGAAAPFALVKERRAAAKPVGVVHKGKAPAPSKTKKIKTPRAGAAGND